jgi:hypothetical protein
MIAAISPNSIQQLPGDDVTATSLIRDYVRHVTVSVLHEL